MRIKWLLLTARFCYLFVTVHAQEVRVICRASADCNGGPGDDLGVMTIGQCCLDTPNGLGFTVEQVCSPCVVFGFIQDSFIGVERVQGHTVQAGYQKGAASAETNLFFNVLNIPGTAREGAGFDYIVNTTQVRALFSRPTPPDDVLFIFRMDSIAQEENETLTLELRSLPTITLPTGRNVFFRSRVHLTIIDSDVQQQVSVCRASVDCNGAPGDDLGVMTIGQCCLETPNGLGFSEGEVCSSCIVFGFFQDSFIGVEQVQGHTVQAGYQKGAASAATNLVFNVLNIPGTAREGAGFDYTVTTTQVRVLFSRPTPPEEVLFIFRMDSIDQEEDETLTLELRPLPLITLPTGRNVFFRNTVHLTIIDSEAQPQKVVCRASADCNGGPGDDLGLMTIEQCCLDTPNGLGFSEGEVCSPCVVFGFFQDSFVGVEQVQGYTLQAGYQKGAASAATNLVFNVLNKPGTAREGAGFDYIVNTTQVRALFSRPTPPDDVLFIFRMDSIAQEENETLTLELRPLLSITLPTGRNVFFRNTVHLTIIDTDAQPQEIVCRASTDCNGGPGDDLGLMTREQCCFNTPNGLGFSYAEFCSPCTESETTEAAGIVTAVVISTGIIIILLFVTTAMVIACVYCLSK